MVCPTSYDYDAPLNEAGDPTPKYYALRKVIGKVRSFYIHKRLLFLYTLMKYQSSVVHDF